jgi:hypothetical protein
MVLVNGLWLWLRLNPLVVVSAAVVVLRLVLAPPEIMTVD